MLDLYTIDDPQYGIRGITLSENTLPVLIKYGMHTTFKDLEAEEASNIAKSLERTSEIVKEICEKAHIAPVPLMINYSNSFGEKLLVKHMITPFPGKENVSHAIIIDPRHISGLNALVSYESEIPAARPDLQFSDKELYSIIAHEVGHVLYPSSPPGSKHDSEFFSDAKMIEFGGTSEDLTRAILKMVRHRREVEFKKHKEAGPQSPALKFLSEDHLSNREGQKTNLTQDVLSHPSFRSRLERMRELENEKGDAIDLG